MEPAMKFARQSEIDNAKMKLFYKRGRGTHKENITVIPTKR